MSGRPSEDQNDRRARAGVQGSRAAQHERLRIEASDLAAVDGFLNDPANALTEGLLELLDRYGGAAEVNRKADEAGRLQTRFARLREERSPHLPDLEWLLAQRDSGAFVTLADYRRRVLGPAGEAPPPETTPAVTLEISALQFFPWLITEARRAIERRELMPGRVIRVRNMKEQTRPGGDLLAVAAALQIIGASHVETLDCRGTDGANVHLGGPETITGYFGGIGQPNDYPLRWADEYLRCFTEYGVRQVLNVNPGTILAALLLRKLGVRNEFKVSVFVGVDNPFSALWLFMAARLLAAEDGSTSLAGLNFSNSADASTLRLASRIRDALGLTEAVRLEHHVTEAYRSIVRQPYDRRAELVAVAAEIPNLSAKHEGGDPEVEASREHPSDVTDYFIPEQEVLARGLMPALEQNYLDKHDALNRTATELIRAGIDVRPATLLHATR